MIKWPWSVLSHKRTLYDRIPASCWKEMQLFVQRLNNGTLWCLSVMSDCIREQASPCHTVGMNNNNNNSDPPRLATQLVQEELWYPKHSPCLNRCIEDIQGMRASLLLALFPHKALQENKRDFRLRSTSININEQYYQIIFPHGDLSFSSD